MLLHICNSYKIYKMIVLLLNDIIGDYDDPKKIIIIIIKSSSYNFI